MIKIHFAVPTSEQWHAWLRDCASAQAVHDASVLGGQPGEADSGLYGRLKKTFYLSSDGPFHGKCAFCEDRIRTNQHGDIEHFRPKGAIIDETTGQKFTRRGSTDPHPGYYWLAYDWLNLLPACQLCNQPSTEPEGGRVGKRNYFPIADETKRAQATGDEAHEEPLLINPVAEDPEPHLGVDGKSGVMFARNGSPKGEICIRIFGLNLRDLPDERADVYRETRIVFKALIDARFSSSVELPQLEQKYQRILDGNVRFAAVARVAIADVKRELLDAVSRT